jgi:molybdopterin converting factor small subunit
MRCRVMLFAAAAEALGQTSIDLELSPDCTIGELRRKLAERSPKLSPLLPRMLFAIDTEYATDDARITPLSEIACIPPVSGG